MSNLSPSDVISESLKRGFLSQEEADALRAKMDQAQQDAEASEPIATVAPQEQPPREVSPREQREPFRTSALMTGAITGAALATPLAVASGPWAPFVLAGASALGVLEGSLLFDSANDAMMFLGGEKGKVPSMSERLKTGGNEAKLDLMYGMGFGSIIRTGRYGLRAMKRVTSGLTEEAAQTFLKAQDVGVALGTTDVSKHELVRTYGNMIGRLPFVGTPIKRRKLIQQASFTDAADRLFFRLGPSVTVTQSGVNLKRAASQEFKQFRDTANNLYDQFRNVAEQTGAHIPMTETKKAAFSLLKEIAEGRPIMRNGKPITIPIDDPALDWFRQVIKLRDSIPMKQYGGLMDDWDVLVTKNKGDSYKVSHLLNVKSASEADLQNVFIPKNTPPTVTSDGAVIGEDQVRALLAEADEYFSTTSKIFENATAKKFGRVEKNIFKLRFEEFGTIEADELRNVVINTKSPEALSHLKRLVGDKDFFEAVGGRLDDAFEKSVTTAGKNKFFNSAGFIENLGLNNPKSAEYAATERMLRGSGVKLSDLKALAEVADIAFREGLPDPSTFVSRRLVLGGVGSAATALLPGAGAIVAGAGKSGAIKSVAGVLLGRGLSKWWTDPQFVRNLTTALDTNLPAFRRQASVVRLLRMLEKSGAEPGEDDAPDTDEERKNRPGRIADITSQPQLVQGEGTPSGMGVAAALLRQRSLQGMENANAP